MADLNISLSKQKRQSSSYKKQNLSLRLFCFSPSAVVQPVLYNSLHRQRNTRNHSIPISEMFFTFLRVKVFEKKFLVECLRSTGEARALRGARAHKRQGCNNSYSLRFSSILIIVFRFRDFDRNRLLLSFASLVTKVRLGQRPTLYI